MITRFAPSTTGPAHPGTLLSALLTWLDTRSRDGEVFLRLENLDPQRCRPEFAEAMQHDLAWLGLDWDDVVLQSEQRPVHEAAMDQLTQQGLVYPCSCSRAEIKARSHIGPDGGYAYDNRCRNRQLPVNGWRASPEALRLRLPDIGVSLKDAFGRDLSQAPARALGDPVIVRRDGAIAYHLATVADDSAAGVTHLIRGHDLAGSAATQVLIYQLLDCPVPEFRHHFLFLESDGDKLAKLHGAIGAETLRNRYLAPELCGMLAHWAGLAATPDAITPTELIPHFSWNRVRRRDLVLRWDGNCLRTG